MKKEIIIELIEDNRLKEAIDLLKKETKNTYLYNQVIVLSASYEDYLKLEITGMEDYSVRTQKRSQLVNGLLYIVDKVAEHKTEHSPIQTPKVRLPFDSKYLKNIAIGIGIVALLAVFLNIIKNRNENAATLEKKKQSELFDLEIIIVKNDNGSRYTEGGKIKVKMEGSKDTTLMLNAEGKAYLQKLSYDLKDKKLSVQFEDTTFYSLKNQEITETGKLKTLKATAQMQMLSFSGRVVRYDKEPVKNLTLDFAHGLAQAMTNNNGEYTVDLPKNLANTTIELSIIENDKAVISRPILINEKVLSLLKVY